MYDAQATPSVAASTSTVLIPALIRLWQQFIASPTIVSAAQDVLATLATNERCSALLTAQLLPVLKATMLHRDAFPGTVEVRRTCHAACVGWWLTVTCRCSVV